MVFTSLHMGRRHSSMVQTAILLYTSLHMDGEDGPRAHEVSHRLAPPLLMPVDTNRLASDRAGVEVLYGRATISKDVGGGKDRVVVQGKAGAVTSELLTDLSFS